MRITSVSHGEDIGDLVAGFSVNHLKTRCRGTAVVTSVDRLRKSDPWPSHVNFSRIGVCRICQTWEIGPGVIGWVGANRGSVDQIAAHCRLVVVDGGCCRGKREGSGLQRQASFGDAEISVVEREAIEMRITSVSHGEDIGDLVAGFSVN